MNWALRRDFLPDVPEPLTYEEHLSGGERFVFGTALLFRHEHLHLAGLPFLRLSYPQFNIRLYVRDHEGVPAVYFQRVLVPGWVVPSARWVAHQPAHAAHFRYPELSREPDSGSEWSWEVEQKSAVLGVKARVAAPHVGAGPDLGSWERTVGYFRHRSRGYVDGPGGLQEVATTQPETAMVPLSVSVEQVGLLQVCFGLDPGLGWPEPHSAWVCPEVPYEFAVSHAGLQEGRRRSAPPVAPDPAMFRRRHSAQRRTAA